VSSLAANKSPALEMGDDSESVNTDIAQASVLSRVVLYIGRFGHSIICAGSDV